MIRGPHYGGFFISIHSILVLIDTKWVFQRLFNFTMKKGNGIRKFKTSRLLDIRVSYNGEKFRFNLFEELAISEEKINSEIKNQPSNYGFLLLLSQRLKTEFFKLKEDRKRLGGKLFLEAKQSSGTNGRAYNDDMAKAYVESNPKYVKLTQQCVQAKDDADIIWAAVKAFEQRASLIQTISSNKRNEKF